MNRHPHWSSILTAITTLLGASLAAAAIPATSRRLPVNKAQVLAAMPTNPGVLINIHKGLFPATADITLLGQRATPALRKGLLGNTLAAVRWRSAQVLTQLRDASARPELHQALSDWSPAVRHQAMQALAYLGDASSVPHLIKRLTDKQETMTNRVAALRALGKIGDGRAAQAIVDQYGHSPDQAYVRRAAILALWDLRRRVPAATVRKLLHRGLADSDALVVRRAAIASGIARDGSALPRLQKLLKGNDRMLRNVAAYVLGRIGDKAAIPILVGALPAVRSGRLLNNISFALKRLGDPKLWSRLSGLLQHRQAFIRLNAAYTVGEMKLLQGRAQLQQMTADPNRLVRINAVVALAKLNDRRAIPTLLSVIQANKGQGELQRWALRGVLFLSAKKRYRDHYLTLSLRGRHQREAALALAAAGDQRAAPLLYPLVRQRHDRQAWKAAGTLRSPVLNQLLLNQLQAALGRDDVRLIEPLLAYVGPTQSRQMTRKLVGLLYRRWGRFNGRHVSDRSALLAVIRALGHSENPEVRTWLAPFLAHRSYAVRMQARLALARLGDQASLSELVRRLDTASDHHRPYLTGLLGQLPPARLRPGLNKLLARPDPYLKLAVGAALLYAGETANRQLLGALRSPQAMIRHRARYYLARRMDPARHRFLRQIRKTEADPIAQAELDRLVLGYSPLSPVFRDFVPRKVVLF